MAGDDSDDDKKREPLWPPLPEMGEDRIEKLMASKAEPGAQSPQLMEATDFDNWITPRETLLAITQHFEREQTIKALLNRLSLGLIHGAAEMTIWSTHEGEDRLPFIVMPKVIWDRPYTFDSKSDFWKTGDYTSHLPRQGYQFDSRTYIAYAGARFDPDGIIALAASLGIEPDWPKRFLGRNPWSGGEPDTPAPPASGGPTRHNLPPPEARTSDLSGDDAKRFSHAILAGWPDSTREFARAKALLFFPDKKVPRDWFYNIFSLIRGHRNPGKLPKKRD
jgi:hypothetical protein